MQQRARDMARELVSSMLDVQIKQLEQNGLQKLDIYKDIKSMRKNIDALVESEMRDVVAILVDAQKVEPRSRARISPKPARRFARSSPSWRSSRARTWPVGLRIAELTAQVKILIEKQTGVRKTTETLTDDQRQKQAELTLDTIQNPARRASLVHPTGEGPA